MFGSNGCIGVGGSQGSHMLTDALLLNMRSLNSYSSFSQRTMNKSNFMNKLIMNVIDELNDLKF